jgi:Orsellinic acid/F9775 biosynthesis cluster protein D
MSSSSSSLGKPLPASLEHLLLLNTEYQVLICRNNLCQKAVELKALSEHLRTIYKTKLELRRQVEAYVADFLY